MPPLYAPMALAMVSNQVCDYLFSICPACELLRAGIPVLVPPVSPALGCGLEQVAIT